MVSPSFVLALIALWGDAARAFVYSPAKRAGSPPSRVVLRSGSGTLEEDPLADVRTSYIEVSRQYRRTRYTHDDWLKHRSPDRFLSNLAEFSTSGIYRGILKEVGTVAVISSFVVLWNVFLGEGWIDSAGAHHDTFGLPLLKLPLTPFTLASPSLGLLLVFRTNSAYRRWDEARKAWGLVINNSRNIARMGTAWINEPDEEVRQRKLDRLAKCIWAFPRSLARHMQSAYTGEADYVADLRDRLDPQHADGLIQSAHRPNRALFDLATAVNDLSMHSLRRNEIDKSIVVLGDQKGASERLFSSPVPLFYTRHTARFLTIWMLLLPLGLYDSFKSMNHIGMIPCAAVLALFLFGIEELAFQLEEPFSILPLVGYSNTIGDNAVEIAQWRNIYDEDPAKRQMD
eukprot:CAMPEP_0197721830 /NCGR_PEP_ID=MMETSP1434-20131217/4742_1 /TAXON_ID=265543 /ORGANISM="Minutocellus polymorphus, Strain CCMP3303" /LENGTH=399 /DNA_ID=CAMNT_0043306895 /DNA_START=62 /DNA_END=1258 /DNA_ORIENTATION=+